MVIYISVLIGAVIYSLIDYVSDNNKEVLTKKYLLTTLANVAAGVALVWMLNLNEAVFEFNGFDFAKVIGATFGIFGQKLFKAVIKLADKNIRTKIGLNESKG